MFRYIILLHCMYQKLQKIDINQQGGGPSIAMVLHLRMVSNLFHD